MFLAPSFQLTASSPPPRLKMPFDVLHNLLPFLQDPVVKHEEFRLKSEKNSKIYLASGTFLGLEIAASGFTPEDALNNFDVQLSNYLTNLFDSATDPNNYDTFLACTTSTPQFHNLKSKMLALDRSFNAIESVQTKEQKGEQLDSCKNDNFVSLLFSYAAKNKLPSPKFEFFVERSLHGCTVEFDGTRYTFEAKHSRKAAVKEAICKHILKCLIEAESKS